MADDGIRNDIRPIEQSLVLNEDGTTKLDLSGIPIVVVRSADNSDKVASQFIPIKVGGSLIDDGTDIDVDASKFASPAQGALADTALQNIPNDILTEPEADVLYIREDERDTLATSDQGELADTALQSFTEINDLVVGESAYVDAIKATADTALQSFEEVNDLVAGQSVYVDGIKSVADDAQTATEVSQSLTDYTVNRSQLDLSTKATLTLADSALQPDGDGSQLTGITATSTIPNSSIAEVKLKISNDPSDGDVLQYKDSTDQLTWIDPVTNTDTDWSGLEADIASTAFIDGRFGTKADVAANTLKTGITTTQADAIVANTVKIGITASQTAAIIANTSKTGITTEQATAITNNTAKTGITTAQTLAITTNTAKIGITSSQASAIVANTNKTGITSSQANAIIANTAKTGITTDQTIAITTNTAKTGITSAQASAIVANTAKVANATHTGEVTGSVALTISDNVVDEANLKISNTPSDGDVLQYKDDTDQLTWAQDGAGVADDSIAEVKLKISNTPTDGDILEYRNSTDELTWSSPSSTAIADGSVDEGKLDITNTGIAGQVLSLDTDTTKFKWVDDEGGATAAELARITANEGNITTNQGNITTNSGNITTNQGNITTNQGNITTNSGNITTNQGNITTNSGKITANEDRLLETVADWVSTRQYNDLELISFTGDIYKNIEVLVEETYNVGVTEMEVQEDNGVATFIIIKYNSSTIDTLSVNSDNVTADPNGVNYSVLIAHTKYTSVGATQATGDLGNGQNLRELYNASGYSSGSR